MQMVDLSQSLPAIDGTGFPSPSDLSATVYSEMLIFGLYISTQVHGLSI